jgi:hypothetical protein
MEGSQLRGPAERDAGDEGRWQQLEQWNGDGARVDLRSRRKEVYSQDCQIIITSLIVAHGYNKI